MDKRGQEIVSTLYEYYKLFPNKMEIEDDIKASMNSGGINKLEVIKNFIAGMTDRYAIKKYEEIILI